MNLELRRIQPSDYDLGVLQLLSQLTSVGEHNKKSFEQQLARMQPSSHVFVIHDLDKNLIVAMGTLLLEHKLVHGNGRVGHIEDIVTDQKYRGAQLGKRIILHLKQVAQELGCYKVILDCSLENVGFYNKCGFKQKEVQMVCYFDSQSSAKL